MKIEVSPLLDPHFEIVGLLQNKSFLFWAFQICSGPLPNGGPRKIVF